MAHSERFALFGRNFQMDLHDITEFLDFYFVHVSINRSLSTISKEFLIQADFIVSLNREKLVIL